VFKKNKSGNTTIESPPDRNLDLAPPDCLLTTLHSLLPGPNVMPPRKKAASESTTEPERRSTRIRDAPPKPKPATTAAATAAAKKAKKTDPELAEWRPTKKPAAKKRKKADVDVEDGEDDAGEEEDKPKKKVC